MNRPILDSRTKAFRDQKFFVKNFINLNKFILITFSMRQIHAFSLKKIKM